MVVGRMHERQIAEPPAPQTSLTKHKFKDKIIENFTMASVCMPLLRVGPCVTTPVLLEVQQYGWNFVQKI